MADARPLDRPATPTPRGVEDNPQDWMHALRSVRRSRDEAQARLYDVLLRAARNEAERRWSPAAALDEPGDLASKAATAAVLAIASDIGGYSGGAQFMTWACKYVINRLSDEAGRRFWLTRALPPEELDWKRLATRPGAP